MRFRILNLFLAELILAAVLSTTFSTTFSILNNSEKTSKERGMRKRPSRPGAAREVDLFLKVSTTCRTPPVAPTLSEHSGYLFISWKSVHTSRLRTVLSTSEI